MRNPLMTYGIERINLYAGRFSLNIAELAEARGLDPNPIREKWMCDERSVYPPFEDAVTLAVNAAKPLLRDDEKKAIELVIVGTESGVDFGKPVATWVHRYCGLSASCRVLELKHACYGCTGALKMALAWLASNGRPEAKALVIGTDLTRPGLGAPAEPVGGGCAAALLLGAEPRILEMNPAHCGYWTHEIADTFRPTAHAEQIDEQISLGSYLDALEGAFEAFRSRARSSNPPAEFDAHIFHAPFPGMARIAHRTLAPLWSPAGADDLETVYEQKVAPGLRLNRRIGTCYGCSNFVSLAGLLTSDRGPEGSFDDKELSLFSYGSGCQGEFYAARTGAEASRWVKALEWDQALDERVALTVADYEQVERARSASTELRNVDPAASDPGGRWRDAYADRGLLVLDRIHDFKRAYRWS